MRGPASARMLYRPRPRPPPAPPSPLFTPQNTRAPSPPPAASSAPLIVSLVDGTVLAVDPGTGATLWRFDTGGPLLSAAGLGPGERPWVQGSEDDDDGGFPALGGKRGKR